MKTIKLNWEIIERITDNFCKENNQKFEVILAIVRGGLVPAVILSHKLGVNDVKTTRIKRNKTNEIYSKKTKPSIDPSFDFSTLKDKKILVVDDIVGTGGTLSFLEEKFKQNNIKNYFIFSLVKFDGDYSPPDNLKIDWYGITCKDWVIFPWE